jgi:hypothetical protein
MNRDIKCVFYVVAAANLALPIAFAQLIREPGRAHYALSAASVAILILSMFCSLAALSISWRIDSKGTNVVFGDRHVTLPCKVCVGCVAVGASCLIASFMLV